MDILQLHQNRYAPFVSFFVKEILVNKEVPKSLVEYFTTMIVCHLPAGDTIREIGLFVYHSRQHKLPDLMKSEWRWLNIHLPTIGDFGIEDVVSTETALVCRILTLKSFDADAASWNSGRLWLKWQRMTIT